MKPWIKKTLKHNKPILLVILSLALLASSFIAIPRYLANVEQEKQQSSVQLYNEALLFYQRNENEKALTKITQAIDRYPQEDYYLLRININANLSDYEKVLLDYNVLIHLDPNNASYLKQRAVIHQTLGDYEHALEDYNLSLSLVKNTETLAQRNELLFSVLDRLSVTQINAMLTLEPDSQDLIYARALLLYQNNDYRGALDDFLALDYYETSYDILISMAQCYYNLDQYRQASDAYSQAFSLDSSDKNLLLYQASILALVNDTSQAANLYREYLNFSPDDSDVILALVETLIATDDYNQALDYLARYANLNPTNSEAYYQMGYLHYLLGNYLKSAENYLKYFELSKNDNVLATIATAFHLGNDLSQALTYYTKAIDADVDLISSTYQRGSIYIEQKNYQAAVTDFQTTYDADYNPDYSLYNQGIAYMQLSDFQSSTRCFKKVVEISTDQELIALAQAILSRYYVE